MDIPKLSYPYTLVGDALDRMSDDSKRTIINPLMAMTRGLSPDAPIPVPEYSRFTESCLVTAALSAVMGGGVGLLTGLLFGSFDAMSGPTTATLSQSLPLKEEMIRSYRKIWLKMKGWGKNFAGLTMVFSGCECAIQKFRGKQDKTNSIAAGCVSGAALATKAGFYGMCAGCVSFAIFSYVIDSFFEYREDSKE